MQRRFILLAALLMCGCADRRVIINERTIEKPSDTNKGYPVCRFTTSINVEVNSILALNSKTLILGGKNQLLLFDFNTNDISLISKDLFSENIPSTIGLDSTIYYIKFRNKRYKRI